MRTDEPAAFMGGGLVRLRLRLAYDGTAFSGWAKQPGLRTVQRELEAALAQVLRLDRPPTTTVAGRTDAGVHARDQVAHVDLPSEGLDVGELLRRLRGVLPEDLVMKDVTCAPPGFDARFSALWRRYVYRIADTPQAVDPLTRHEVVEHPRPLDIARMNRAAQILLGEHDFAAFCRRREGASTVRTLLEIGWVRREHDGLVVATVRADAFCHSMVRALVGVLMPVGEGRRPELWPEQILRAAVRDPAVTVARAKGLTLEEIAYPRDEEMAQRAVEARRFRG